MVRLTCYYLARPGPRAPSELEGGISFPGTMWTENRVGNFADFLKENQEAISEEGGLDDPEQRKTADVC